MTPGLISVYNILQSRERRHQHNNLIKIYATTLSYHTSENCYPLSYEPQSSATLLRVGTALGLGAGGGIIGGLGFDGLAGTLRGTADDRTAVNWRDRV